MLNRCDALLVRHDNDCGYSFQGKAYAQLLDSLGELLGARGLRLGSVAVPRSRLVGERAWNAPVEFNGLAHVIARVSGLAGRLAGARRAKALHDRLTAMIWRRILRQSGASCVVAIEPSRGLCRAAKALGVPVHEAQHGNMISDLRYDEELNREIATADLPDEFLCWDEQSTSGLRRWAPQRGIAVSAIGNPWFLRFMNPADDDDLVAEARARYPAPSDDAPRILVTLQWDLGRIFYPGEPWNGVMDDALESVIQDTAGQIHWMLRMHPVVLRDPAQKGALEYLERTFGHLNGVEWDACSRAPLPLVLSRTDLHITDSSAVVIEAAWMGVRSALLNPDTERRELYLHERQQGFAQVVPRSEAAIREWIRHSLATPAPAAGWQDRGAAMAAWADRIQGMTRTGRRGIVPRSESRLQGKS